MNEILVKIKHCLKTCKELMWHAQAIVVGACSFRAAHTCMFINRHVPALFTYFLAIFCIQKLSDNSRTALHYRKY